MPTTTRESGDRVLTRRTVLGGAVIGGAVISTLGGAAALGPSIR